MVKEKSKSLRVGIKGYFEMENDNQKSSTTATFRTILLFVFAILLAIPTASDLYQDTTSEPCTIQVGGKLEGVRPGELLFLNNKDVQLDDCVHTPTTTCGEDTPWDCL